MIYNILLYYIGIIMVLGHIVHAVLEPSTDGYNDDDDDDE